MRMLMRVFDEEISPLVADRLSQTQASSGLPQTSASQPGRISRLWTQFRKWRTKKSDLEAVENVGVHSAAPTTPVAEQIAAVRKGFVDEVKKSRFRPEQAEYWFVRVSVKLSSYLNATQSNEMSREEFIRRVAVSELGPQIAELGDRADDTIERIGLRYDEMAAGAREYMKSSSAVFSLIIGIGVQSFLTSR